MSSLNNSAKSMTSCGRVGISLADHSSLASYCYLVHVKLCRRQLAATTDLRCERQLESVISRTAAASPLRLRFRQIKYAGFSAHNHADRLAGYSGDPSLCTQEVYQSTKSNKRTPIQCQINTFETQQLGFCFPFPHASLLHLKKGMGRFNRLDCLS